ncbi:MAG: hypothetical protein D6824_03475 [Planctomycetota bacterium]|nr:MAG: hypothetical protein D6824_03475 [Planctomycetota bacterium]
MTVSMLVVLGSQGAPPPVWIEAAPGDAATAPGQSAHAVAWAPAAAILALLLLAAATLLMVRLQRRRRRARPPHRAALDADRAFRRLSRAARLPRARRQELEHKAGALGLHPLALLVCPETLERSPSAGQASQRPAGAAFTQRSSTG